MTERTLEQKKAFIQEAIASFEEMLNDPQQRKHAVFLVYDNETSKMQTYTFNADLNTLFMMVTSAYEMMQETQSGHQLRTLN